MKRVLILTLSIGNGHKAKANALHDYLKDMDVKIIDIFSNKIKGNKIYLYCLNHKLWLCVKMIIKAKSVVDKLYSLFYQSSLEKQILEYKPDTIINTTPMMSRALLNISKKHNLKYIIAPSDFNYMDLKHWGVPRNENNFEYWIPYAFEEEKTFFAQNNIKISITGFIVDDAFKNEVENTLKNQHNCNTCHDMTNLTSSAYKYTHMEIAKAMSEKGVLIASTGGATINEILYVMGILNKHKLKYFLCLIDVDMHNSAISALKTYYKVIFVYETERTKALYWEQANVEFLSKYMKYENLIAYDLRYSVIRREILEKRS